MKKGSTVWVVAGLMILVGCVSAERQAEYAAWQDSEDGVRTVQLPEFESKYRQGWRERAAEKKKARIAREEAERVLAERKAEYRRWLASDDKEESVSFESFEQKYKEGWEARAAQKKRVRLAKEAAERAEKQRLAMRTELYEMTVEYDLADIMVCYSEGDRYENPFLGERWRNRDETTDWLAKWSSPRLGMTEADALAGEALLSEFGTKYLPNAYA